MWAQQAGSFNSPELNSKMCEYVFINTNCACGKCKNVKSCECIYVSVAVVLYLIFFSRDAYLCDLQVFELGWQSAVSSGQAKPKNSQAKPLMGSC
jgi:hypothetical protein